MVSVQNILQVLKTDLFIEEFNWNSARNGCTNLTLQLIISLGSAGLIREPTIKKALHEPYAVIGRIESWAELRWPAHVRINDFLSKTLPADLRMWVNKDVNRKEWANKKNDVEALLNILRSQQELEAALE